MSCSACSAYSGNGASGAISSVTVVDRLLLFKSGAMATMLLELVEGSGDGVKNSKKNIY
jgi:hypothetical protein